jgi:hypothetical protein
MSLFIDDGYTRAKDIDAVAGIHPAVSVTFRPALSAKRTEYGVTAGTNNAAKIGEFENDLLAKHVVTLDGSDLKKADAARLIPTLRATLLNLVLGYEPADEAADAGN